MEDEKELIPRYDLICETRPEQDGMTVRAVLRHNAGVSRRLMRSIVHDIRDAQNAGGSGSVYVNGQRSAFVCRASAGDVIGLVYPAETTHIEAEDIPLDVLYEDDDLLALNKMPGRVVHPTKGHPSGTVANGVVAHMQSRGESYKPRFVNRLDMGTSGVLLVGKNSHAQNDFTAQAGRGETVKKYLAAVDGIVANDEGVIDLPIELEAEGSPRRAVTEGGAPSVTRYRVCARLPHGAGGISRAYTTLEVILETGRTHQIRVHFAHIGHPVLGDTLYGDADTVACAPRQVLHARSLTFAHPRTGERITIEAPLPEDIAGFFG
ncbi:MAG: RluA family pseudouridine synthase [Clostridiales Family XIII bacterium]|jgi:23S rRNA pseudouridine1911/1915/1917 synthase|nr:RluA family pseudouridine synthase [Clostridiales Family XIII bacterium]